MTGKLILSSLCLLFLTNCFAQKSLQEHFEYFDRIQSQEKIYVETDRTLYQPGNTIWFSAFASNAANCSSTKSSIIYVELIDPRGTVIETKFLKNENGCIDGGFRLYKETLGGIYRLRAYTYWMQNFGKEHYFEKELTIQKVILPNVLMQLDFEREAYGVGSQVIASFEAKTKENKVLSNKGVRFDVFAAGQPLCKETTTTDKNGTALIVFTLPKDLKTADVLLNLKLEQDGLTESISRSVPVVLNNLEVQLLPEGGNLIANQLNRVAFKVLNEFGKPADIKAQLLNENNELITTFESYHQGMGAFEFIPKEEQQYSIRLLSPTGIDKKWELPKASNNKIGLYVRKETKKELIFDVYCPKNQTIEVAVQQQGKFCYNKALKAKKGVNTWTIPIEEMPMGIAQLTIFNAKQQAQCERLFFANKHRHLDLKVTSSKATYLPREEVELTVEATDETGKGVAGNFAIAVTDDKEHQFMDDKQDNILSYLLMSSDLKGKIHEPNFYFDPKEEKADSALNYVLLTHGWRRYDWDNLLTTDVDLWADSILYTVDSDEISGYLKINKKLYAEKRLFLSEGKPAYNRKKALMYLETNKNGFFKFKRAGLTFPVFISVKHQGIRYEIKIPNYSRTGLSLIRKKDAGDLNVFAEESSSGKLLVEHRGTVLNKQKIGIILGRVLDRSNDEGLPFAMVELKRKDNVIRATESDFDGYYRFDSLVAGTYDVKISYVGFPDLITEGITVIKGRTTTVNMGMSESELGSFKNASEEFILINTKRITKGEKKDLTLVRDVDFIRNNPNRNINSIIRTVGVVNQTDEGEAIGYGGSRTGSTLTTIDGVRVVGNLGIQEEDIQVMSQGIESRTRGVQEVNTVVRAYRIPLIDQSNTMGGQTLKSSDILPGSDWRPTDYSYSSGPIRTYDNVALKQVGIRTDYSVPMRFYSPKYKETDEVAKRTDFRKTIYWNPSVTTNSEGKATVTYCNSDEVTTFRVRVEGRAVNGKLGHGEHSYSVQLPFSLTAKIPTTMSCWDTVKIPIILKNTTQKVLTGRLAIEVPNCLEPLDSLPSECRIPAEDVLVVYGNYLVKKIQKKDTLLIRFDGNGFKDVLTQEIEVVGKGKPTHYVVSGVDSITNDTFVIGKHYNGSLDATLELYPSLMEDLIETTSSMLRQPSGCFEQVSSSNYPNILALQLLQDTKGVNPTIRKKALNFLDVGYRKLTAYEIEGGGFEWYGKGPAHEGLTAYGLVQLNDMKAVYNKVDPAVIQRTKDFLLRRRNGRGGFDQQVGKYGFGGNRPKTFNAYITWALSEVNTKEIDQEVESTVKEAIKSNDLYRLSLACLTLFNRGENNRAETLLGSMIATIQKMNMREVRAETSITYSGGHSLNVEVLSLIGLAMMRSSKIDQRLLIKIVKHVLKQRNCRRFGSTQATVLALKMLVQYQRISLVIEVPTAIEIYLNDVLVEESIYEKGRYEKVSFNGLQSHLNMGKNTVCIKFKGKPLPYSFNVGWSAINSSKKVDGVLKLKTVLSTKETSVGELVRMNVQVENTTVKVQPSPMVIVGIPAGLSVQPWQLKALQEKEAFAYYELNKNQLILYFREFDVHQKAHISLDLKAEIPGTYTAPMSRTYLYYTNELKYWEEGTSVHITP